MHAPARRIPLLMVLLSIVVFNYVDRYALGIVLQSIRSDLHLTDTQLGFLTGIAFALFYSIMGVPIARWADRGNRVAIIALTTVLWSIAVFSCGLAKTFVQLLLIRVAIAVGEAGCIPTAFSLLADYFDRAERPRASAILGLGGPLGSALGFVLAGWLNQLYGWRITFMLLGPPGLLLATLAWFGLKEPRSAWKSGREAYSDSHADAVMRQPSMREVGLVLWSSATFRDLVMCLAVIFFFNYGILQWLPTFFMRSYGLTSGEIGSWLAVIVGLGGMSGSYLGGELASRYAAKNERLQLKVMSIAIVGCGGVSTFAYLTNNHYFAIALMGLFLLGVTTINGPLFATLQTLVPDRMRAVAFALVYLFANLIGMGLGPLAAGALSDAYASWAHDESLRYALLTLSPGYAWAAWHGWRGSRTVMRELATQAVPTGSLTPLVV